MIWFDPKLEATAMPSTLSEILELLLSSREFWRFNLAEMDGALAYLFIITELRVEGCYTPWILLLPARTKDYYFVQNFRMRSAILTIEFSGVILSCATALVSICWKSFCSRARPLVWTSEMSVIWTKINESKCTLISEIFILTTSCSLLFS
jgi:hypothetical protein